MSSERCSVGVGFPNVHFVAAAAMGMIEIYFFSVASQLIHYISRFSPSLSFIARGERRTELITNPAIDFELPNGRDMRETLIFICLVQHC
jgi:hypothetical protein